jgi:glycosyltransferase involved in cell wall biosynthesis
VPVHASQQLESNVDSGRVLPTARLGSSHAEPPDILLVIGSLQGGGAERVMSDMANYWANRGCRVTLATWSGPEIQDFYVLAPSVGRVWLDVYSPNDSFVSKIRSNVGRLLKLRRLLVASRPDAILSFIDVSNVQTILAALGLGVRVVVSERVNPSLNYGVTRPWRALRRVSYRWAEAVVAQTYDAAQWIEKQCGTRVLVIPNSLRVLPTMVCEREPLIVAVGRLSKQKGFDLLLKAFARISSDFQNWRLAIVGVGAERPALIELRDQLNLTDRVEFTGQVRDVESWMARAGLVVQPSRFEGFPNVVLESMGMGATVISADCPSGPSDLIEDGVNGRLVPVEDVAALMRVMAELMSQPQVRERLGREASKVKQRFRQDLIMTQWEACLLPEVRRAPTNARSERMNSK